ncbi:acid protease [Periconia macrospinosa]|uniref:Acid protease n=1 Tax=Periconia macrospinosa TaxID=97972 RepID=A0A2V1EBF4_9PLEO|nr:acid protease [Periconia macrospinosa]
MVAVNIGTSKEEYLLLLDSASSNVWVMSEDCKTTACNKHTTFGKSDSSSLKAENTKFSITYGTGTVSGTTASDTLHFSSLSANLTFGLATNASSEFESYAMDGILGLGRGSKAEGTIVAPQAVEVFANAKLIPAKISGLALGRYKDGNNDGELNFGELNKDRYEGDINWIDAVSNERGFWEIAIADAGAGDKVLGVKNKIGIIDTGSAFVFVPEQEAISIHKLIDRSRQAEENFIVPCSTKTPITLKFGSQTYNITAADWVGEKLPDSDECFSRVIGRQTFGPDQWLIGTTFLKNVYTAFDMDKSRVGFGRVKSANSTSSSSSSGSGTSIPFTSASVRTSTPTSTLTSVSPLEPLTSYPSSKTLTNPIYPSSTAPLLPATSTNNPFPTGGSNSSNNNNNNSNNNNNNNGNSGNSGNSNAPQGTVSSNDKAEPTQNSLAPAVSPSGSALAALSVAVGVLAFAF